MSQSLPSNDDLIKELTDMASVTLPSGYMARTDALPEILDHLEYLRPDAWETVQKLHRLLLGDALMGAEYDEERDAFALKDGGLAIEAKTLQPENSQKAMATTVTIEFSIHGVGEIDILANDVKDAVKQFAVIGMKELAGWCNFTSFEESGVTIIGIDGEEVQSDLWAIEEELGLKAQRKSEEE